MYHIYNNQLLKIKTNVCKITRQSLGFLKAKKKKKGLIVRMNNVQSLDIKNTGRVGWNAMDIKISQH